VTLPIRTTGRYSRAPAAAFATVVRQAGGAGVPESLRHLRLRHGQFGRSRRDYCGSSTPSRTTIIFAPADNVFFVRVLRSRAESDECLDGFCSHWRVQRHRVPQTEQLHHSGGQRSMISCRRGPPAPLAIEHAVEGALGFQRFTDRIHSDENSHLMMVAASGVSGKEPLVRDGQWLGQCRNRGFFRAAHERLAPRQLQGPVRQIRPAPTSNGWKCKNSAKRLSQPRNDVQPEAARLEGPSTICIPALKQYTGGQSDCRACNGRIVNRRVNV